MRPTSPSWYRLMRPHTLTASVMPVLIGTAMAFNEARINWLLFAAVLLASLLIQSAVNMFNEYFDFKRGLDSTESVGIGGVIVHKEMHEKTVFRTAVIFFAASVLIGLYICSITSWWIAAVGSLSMAVGYFYSAGPKPIAYTAFGEMAAAVFMGFVIVLISFFVQTETITFASFLLSVPISILVGAILLANNIRDAEPDLKKGRRTVAIGLGKGRATNLLALMFACTMLWTFCIVLFHLASPSTMVVILCLPKAVKSIELFRKGATPAEMLPAMKAASVVHSQFGVLFSIGLIAGKLF